MRAPSAVFKTPGRTVVEFSPADARLNGWEIRVERSGRDPNGESGGEQDGDRTRN